MYESIEIDENKKSTSRVFQGYLLTGPLSCVNSKTSIVIYFSHRDMSNYFIPLLKWQFKFLRTTTTYVVSNSHDNEVLPLYNVKNVLYVLQYENDQRSDDECFDAETTSLKHELDSVTNGSDFVKVEYIRRVCFGAWVNNEMFNFSYKTHDQIFINYKFD